LDQQVASISSKQYEYILDEKSKLITLPSPSGMHAGMKRHYYFREKFCNDYHISMINRESWQKMKQTNEVKILKIEVEVI
tara:strand:+ start:576 stop:815 length:240 start_codon:yes stop_codon:yes gene_type:complete